MNEQVRKHMSLLGHEVQDKITKQKGVCSSISFDLYGCIQAAITPKVNKDGERHTSYWYDVSRLKVLNNKKRVMTLPNYDFGPVAEGKHGCCNDKPLL